MKTSSSSSFLLLRKPRLDLYRGRMQRRVVKWSCSGDTHDALNALCSLCLSKLYAQEPINISSTWRTLGCTSPGHPDCLAVGRAAAESLTPCAGPPHHHPHPHHQPCPTQRGVKIAPLSLFLHIGSPLCSRAGIWRRGGCNMQEMALLPKPLPQILFKAGASVMGLGIEGKRGACLCLRVGGKVWTCLSLCMHAYICVCVCVRFIVRGLFLDFKLLKGALCAAISLWDSGIGSRGQKQSSLFISWKANEQVSQSEPMTDGWGGGGGGGASGAAVCVCYCVEWGHICTHFYYTVCFGGTFYTPLNGIITQPFVLPTHTSIRKIHNLPSWDQ